MARVPRPRGQRPPKRKRWRGQVDSVEAARGYLQHVHGTVIAHSLIEAGSSALTAAFISQNFVGLVKKLRSFVESAVHVESPLGLPKGSALRAASPTFAGLANMVDAAHASVDLIRGIIRELPPYEDALLQEVLSDLADRELQLAAYVMLKARELKVAVTPSDLAAVAFVVDRSQREGTHRTRANTWKNRLHRAERIVAVVTLPPGLPMATVRAVAQGGSARGIR